MSKLLTIAEFSATIGVSPRTLSRVGHQWDVPTERHGSAGDAARALLLEADEGRPPRAPAVFAGRVEAGALGAERMNSPDCRRQVRCSDGLGVVNEAKGHGMRTDLKMRCQRAPWRDDVEFMALLPRQDGGFDVGEPLTMRKVEPGEYVGDATFRLSNTAAQALMDELWGCGLRPSEGTGSAGSLAATERHLKDMQAIALGLLRKDGVNA